MNGWLTLDGIYYIGDKINYLDIEVPIKPSSNHFYLNGEWILNIQIEKEDKVKLLKQIGTEVIYIKAPLYKQNNAALSIYSAEEIEVIKEWIIAVKSVIDEFELALLNSQSETDLQTIIFDYDIIKEKAESIINSTQ